MDKLKSFVMQSLTTAMEKGAAHIRDPIGGSNAHLFVWVLFPFGAVVVFGVLCVTFAYGWGMATVR